MRLVYLILAHRDPELVNVLVETLRQNRSVGIYLHIDRRVEPAPFVSGLSGRDLRIVRPRVRANWGSYGIVRATLSGLRSVAKHESGPYRFVLLSGQDFPVKPVSFIERYLAESPYSAHIDHARMGTPPGKETNRYARYFLHDQFKVRGSWRLERIINERMERREFPAGFEPYSGSQWWSASDEVIRYVVRFTKAQKKFRRFFWFSNIPDEMFFQTVILNSPFASRISNDNLRYAEWAPKAWSPRALTHADLPMLLDSPALFARKFDDATVTRELARRLSASDRN